MQPDEVLEKYRLLMMATHNAVYDYDFALNRVDWNDNIRLFGYDPADVGSGIEWWAERIHPADRDRVLTLLDATLTGNSPSFDCGYLFRCGDGHYRHALDRGYVLKDSSGHPSRLVGAMQDVHIYEQMFEHSPQPMWAFHRDTLAFLTVNRAAIRLYGYSRDEFLAMRLTDIRPPEDVPMMIAAVRGADRDHEGKSIWRHFTKDHQLLYVEVRTHDFDWNGQPARMALLKDVTRRVSLEEQLRETQKMDAIGMMAGGIAHDFNNLLTVINGYTRLALKRLHPADPLCNEIEAIAEAGAKAEQLTRQLLALARKQVLQPKVLQLNVSIAALRTLLERLLPPEVTLTLQLAPDLGYVKADPSQFEQVILNLVSNARDAIPAAGRILISTLNVEIDDKHPDYRPGVSSGTYSLVTVQDNGKGMSEEVQAHLFEPFFSTKAADKGTGLGLPTVYGIVRQTGGFIRIDSVLGSGAEFRIYFPQLNFSTEISPIRQPSESILILDDDAAVASVTRDILANFGYGVSVVQTGAEARAFAANLQNPIDLLIADLLLDGERGTDVGLTLKQLRPGLPVIYLSGNTQGLEGSFAPADRFLAKPYNPEALAALCEDLLRPRPIAATILVVDDDIAVRRLVAASLSRAGYTVVEAANGLEALSQLQVHEIDVLITDLVMPEKEGLETIQAVRLQYPNLPVIAVSGAFSGQFLGLAKVFGANAALTKPLDLDLLLTEVRSLLS